MFGLLILKWTRLTQCGCRDEPAEPCRLYQFLKKRKQSIGFQEPRNPGYLPKEPLRTPEAFCQKTAPTIEMLSSMKLPSRPSATPLERTRLDLCCRFFRLFRQSSPCEKTIIWKIVYGVGGPITYLFIFTFGRSSINKSKYVFSFG